MTNPKGIRGLHQGANSCRKRRVAKGRRSEGFLNLGPDLTEATPVRISTIVNSTEHNAIQ